MQLYFHGNKLSFIFLCLEEKGDPATDEVCGAILGGGQGKGKSWLVFILVSCVCQCAAFSPKYDRDSSVILFGTWRNLTG